MKNVNVDIVSYYGFFCVVIFTLSSVSCKSVELTFELPDNAKECFHEDINKGEKASVEFQVK